MRAAACLTAGPPAMPGLLAPNEDRRVTLGSFWAPGVLAGKDSWDGEGPAGEAYALRDARAAPDKPVVAWRADLDRLIAGGPPYGKILAGFRFPTVEGWFNAWAARLAGMPRDASPVVVYGLAPEEVLAFLGY